MEQDVKRELNQDFSAEVAKELAAKLNLTPEEAEKAMAIVSRNFVEAIEQFL